MRLTKKTTCTACGHAIGHSAVIGGCHPLVTCPQCNHLQSAMLVPEYTWELRRDAPKHYVAITPSGEILASILHVSECGTYLWCTPHSDHGIEESLEDAKKAAENCIETEV